MSKLELNDLIKHRLQLVKQLFQQSLFHIQASRNDLRKALAVIDLDLTNETMLSIVFDCLGSNDKKAYQFKDFLDQVDALLKREKYSGIANKNQIINVHNIRNGAQHNLNYPSATTMQDCRTYTYAFLKHMIQDIWGLDFDELYLSGLIKNDVIKNDLQNAEKTLANNEYKKAAESAAIGFEISFNAVRYSLVGSDPDFTKEIRMSHIDSIKLVDTTTIESFKKIQDVLAIYSLSINYNDFVKYRNLIGEFVIIPGGNPPVRFVVPNEINNSVEAEFVVHFCIDSILHIESIVGDINKPFGIDDKFH